MVRRATCTHETESPLPLLHFKYSHWRGRRSRSTFASLVTSCKYPPSCWLSMIMFVYTVFRERRWRCPRCIVSGTKGHFPHTRLRARDHCYTSSTLIGGEGGAGPSLLHFLLLANTLFLLVHDYVCIYCFWGGEIHETVVMAMP